MGENDDKEWYVERKRNAEGTGINANHKGLMPFCHSCNQQYKLGKSDNEEFLFMATHVKNSCPFKEVFYGTTDLECMASARQYNELKRQQKMRAR
jgi:hypothetical protein